jgi:hypothetical protein
LRTDYDAFKTAQWEAAKKAVAAADAGKSRRHADQQPITTARAAGGFLADGKFHEVSPQVRRHVTSASQVPGPQSLLDAVMGPTLAPGELRQHGARISTISHDDEDEQAARRRRAVESAMDDALVTGMGVMRFSDAGVDHVSVAEYRGSGGTFDGGGASGDYGSAASTGCSASTSSPSSTDSAASCGSSDSGGGSSGGD